VENEKTPTPTFESLGHGIISTEGAWDYFDNSLDGLLTKAKADDNIRTWLMLFFSMEIQ
jgi:hypothetical protein